jgi:predicted ATPase
MIESIHIKNFKSVVDLSLELGTFNVLIGENGCGKTNILEAIAFGAAANADKLDFEFLGSRGIRVTNTEFMFSAFTNSKKRKAVLIDFYENKHMYSHHIVSDSLSTKNWIDKNKIRSSKQIQEITKSLYAEENEKKRVKILSQLERYEGDVTTIAEMSKTYRIGKDLEEFVNKLSARLIDSDFASRAISDYVIYSPEQSALRKFLETTQIYPLGIKGEGLFQYLKELTSTGRNEKILDDVKEALALLDWYEDFALPEGLLSNEFSLRIKDKYLNESLQYFDQRSTNEGFLFLLFYSVLFISKETPRFFAIDNIDASLNPKLCMQLIRNLVSLGKKHKKQVIVTTHNPAVLDGLNLKDNSQRLFVVRRNDEGQTKAKRVEYKLERKMKMSELWTNGIIGGLPENF